MSEELTEYACIVGECQDTSDHKIEFALTTVHVCNRHLIRVRRLAEAYWVRSFALGTECLAEMQELPNWEEEEEGEDD